MSIRSTIREFVNGLREHVQALVDEAEQRGAEKAYQECLVQLCAELGVPGSPSFDEAVAYLRQREDNWAAVAKVAREVNVEMRAAEAVCIAAEESELEADLPWRIEDALVEWHMVKQKGAESPAEERQQGSPADGGINIHSLIVQVSRNHRRMTFILRGPARLVATDFKLDGRWHSEPSDEDRRSLGLPTSCTDPDVATGTDKMFDIELPVGAEAVRIKTEGSARIRALWFDGDRTETDVVDRAREWLCVAQRMVFCQCVRGKDDDAD